MTETTSFDELLAEIRRDCGWEQMPESKLPRLAQLCGPDEIRRLIAALDALDEEDIADDAGDMADEYALLRASYTRVLALSGEQAAEPLLRALSSRNPATWACAARALGQLREPRAFEAISALLAQAGDVGERLPFVQALGTLGDSRGFEVLLPLLKAPAQLNRGWLIRVTAEALGRLGPVAIAPLAEVLQSESDWFARLGAAEGLALIADARALAALEAAQNDSDGRVRQQAAAGVAALKKTLSV